MVQKIPTAGVILAAGVAIRFGRPKQLLRLKNRYLIEWVLDAAINSKLSKIVLVLGSAHEKILQAIDQKLLHAKIHIEINPDFKEGQSSSLRAGLSVVKDDFAAVMFLLADQPLIDAASLNILLKHFWSADKDICVPTFAGQRGNPCIFSKRFYPHIMEITGDIGARQLIQAYPEHVLEVEIDNPHFFSDVDTPEDLDKIKKIV